ncbi:MAG: peptidase [Xanthomonadaceae bacterium]|nr:peptidase [Xanthomonadaceae bacterium]
MNIRTPSLLLLPLAVAGALAIVPPPAQAQARQSLRLDESRLPPVNRFSIEDLDSSKDACADFNGYVNGRWLASNEIPGDRTSWGAFSILDERSIAIQHQLVEQAARNHHATGTGKIIGDFWVTGMDEARINAEGITPLNATLAQIDALDGAEAIIEYLRQTSSRGRNLIFLFGTEADFRDSSRNMAYVFPAGLGLPDKSYYFDDDKKDKLAAYQAHVARVLELSGVRPADATRQAGGIIAFETRLARVSKSREEMSRDVSLYYNPVSLSEADALTPAFSWTELFRSQGVAPQPKFSLAIPQYHEEFGKMLGDTDPAIWRAYLRFHTVDQASPYLSDAFADENYGFYGKTLNGQKEMKPRWKRVLDTINGAAGEALGQMYVQVAFPPESKAAMETLVQNLSQSLKTRIENLAWMSDETKQKALAKWATFTPKIGYPDKWRDWSGLSTQRNSYLDNVLAAIDFNHQWELGKIGQPVDPAEWGMTPQTVNAYYNPLRNEIVFPAAILQPPFFDPNADAAINYGGIGAVIGHEMTHGYDDQGSRFGPTGNFENWWTPADTQGFEARTGRLIAQFNEYEAFPGEHVNGKLTLGENIADLGGLATAYDAMKIATAASTDPMAGGKTRDQNFFFNWATVWRTQYTPENLRVRLTTDPHAPAQFRAAGAPSNLEAFGEAFSCKPGEPMLRRGEKQVVIW